MVRLGEAMLDTVRLADHVKAHLTRAGGVPVAGLLSELDAVIGSDMLGRPMLDEQIAQHVNHVVRPEAPQRHQRRAFPAELVDNVKHPELTTVVHLILDEVVGPHMPAILRAQPDARSVAEPEPPPFRLPLRRFKTLPPPETLDHRQADLQLAWPSKAWMRR